ncbi:MAG: SPOR domain-containing protein [Pseudomonadota bacterium]|nr:SPOR domain-containing protein [Pseudomonadota bacterium]
MDRRVKERLIGASILVALIVLVVPELLSGPKAPLASAPRTAIAPEPTRNVTVDLATSKAPANSEVEPGTQGSTASPGPPTVAASAAQGTEAVPTPSAAAPVATPATTSAATPATAPASSSSAAPARPAAVETAVSSPISSRTAWAVQLGSFANRANAENLSHRLKGQGFPVYVLPGGSGTSVRYRVRVGPLANRDSAERTAAKLKSIGHVSSLVAPAG